MQDFEAAQKDYVPLSLRDVKLTKSNVSWNDIGGCVFSRLHDAVNLNDALCRSA